MLIRRRIALRCILCVRIVPLRSVRVARVVRIGVLRLPLGLVIRLPRIRRPVISHRRVAFAVYVRPMRTSHAASAEFPRPAR